MNQEEVESQLSAMFDGELSIAECELLSRRIDRDERLRARWSRYALIGAAMRSEPVATARSGFAARVSAALLANDPKPLPRGLLLNGALAASLVILVAGASISVLRYLPRAVSQASGSTAQAPPQPTAPPAAVMAASAPAAAPATPLPGAARRPFEPWSYVTPRSSAVAGNALLRTELADYIVAHSVYSAPLMRRNLLSALMSGEDASSAPGDPDAPIAAPAPSR